MSRMALVMGPQCLVDAYRRLLRTMCTTQVCTVASGQVARIEEGSPLSPSQHTISASARPRLRSSVSIVAHCLAPSPPAGPSHSPSTSRSP